MATYYKLGDGNIVEFDYDEYADVNDSREWENLGEFVTFGPKIDKHKYNDMLDFLSEYGVKNATSKEDAYEKLKKAAEKKGEYVYPVSKLEHGYTSFHLSFPEDLPDGKWDGTFMGFARVTPDRLKMLGTPVDLIEDELQGELSDYQKAYNGEVMMLNEYSPEDGYDMPVDAYGGLCYDDLDEAVRDQYGDDFVRLGEYYNIDECVEDNLKELGMKKQARFVKDDSYVNKDMSDIRSIVANDKTKASNGPATSNTYGNGR